MNLDHSFTISGALVDGEQREIRCQSGRITHVARHVPPADQHFDFGGCEVIPGLHDHHIHLRALAAADQSIRLGPLDVANERGARTALQEATGTGWLRAINYHESVAGDIDRHWLDTVIDHRPVRAQHRSGRRWILNSLACETIDLAALHSPAIERDPTGRPTGRVTGADNMLRQLIPPLTLDMSAVGQRLAAFGVTGVTDLTPMIDASEAAHLAASCLTAEFPLSVHITGSPDLVDPHQFGFKLGPVKIVIGDHDLPQFDMLVGQFRQARNQGRCVAVHAVTHVAVALCLAAWDVVAPIPGDRIEHGSLISLAAASQLAHRNITVITQPRFVFERGDEYRRDVDADDVSDLWRCGSLVDAGVGVAIGTDAPYGSDNPWLSMASAVDRVTATGAHLGRAEGITHRRSLEMFLSTPNNPAGPIRRIAVGQPADICVLDTAVKNAIDDTKNNHVVGTFTHRLTAPLENI